MFNELRHPPGRRQDRRRRRARARLPAAARGAPRGHRPPAGEDPRRRPARVRDPRSRLVNFADVPGFAAVTRGTRRDDRGRRDARASRGSSEYLRDECGFNFLADIAAADYLGWNERTVAGYWGHRGGRDINRPGSWGLREEARAEGEALLGLLSPRLSRLRRPRGAARPAPGLVRRRRVGAERRLRLADRRLARARGLRPHGHPSSRATRT